MSDPDAHPDAHPDVARLRAARPSRVADLVGTIADPAVLVLATTLGVALRSSGSLLAGLGWSLLDVSLCVGAPYAALALLLRRGVVSDRQVVRRGERRLPLLAALACVVLGLLVLTAAGAPRPVVALVVSMLTGLAVMTLVSHAYKASFHAGVAAGSGTVLVATLGAAALAPVALLVALVGWARVRAGRHTPGHVAVGVLVGAVTGVLVFVPLTR